MARNNELGAAKTAKKDEFYTQLTDIEKPSFATAMTHSKVIFSNTLY